MSAADPVSLPARPGFLRELRVRFGHCDPAGIVFFPQYLVMLNELAEDWFDRGLQIPYASFISQRRLGLPTAQLEVSFTAVSRLGDRLVQQLQVTHLGRSSMRLDVAYWGDGPEGAGTELRLRARQVLVCTSLETHRPQPVPEDVRAALPPYMADT